MTGDSGSLEYLQIGETLEVASRLLGPFLDGAVADWKRDLPSSSNPNDIQTILKAIQRYEPTLRGQAGPPLFNAVGTMRDIRNRHSHQGTSGQPGDLERLQKAVATCAHELDDNSVEPLLETIRERRIVDAEHLRSTEKLLDQQRAEGAAARAEITQLQQELEDRRAIDLSALPPRLDPRDPLAVSPARHELEERLAAAESRADATRSAITQLEQMRTELASARELEGRVRAVEQAMAAAAVASSDDRERSDVADAPSSEIGGLLLPVPDQSAATTTGPSPPAVDRVQVVTDASPMRWHRALAAAAVVMLTIGGVVGLVIARQAGQGQSAGPDRASAEPSAASTVEPAVSLGTSTTSSLEASTSASTPLPTTEAPSPTTVITIATALTTLPAPASTTSPVIAPPTVPSTSAPTTLPVRIVLGWDAISPYSDELIAGIENLDDQIVEPTTRQRNQYLGFTYSDDLELCSTWPRSGASGAQGYELVASDDRPSLNFALNWYQYESDAARFFAEVQSMVSLCDTWSPQGLVLAYQAKTHSSTSTEEFMDYQAIGIPDGWKSVAIIRVRNVVVVGEIDRSTEAWNIPYREPYAALLRQAAERLSSDYPPTSKSRAR